MPDTANGPMGGSAAGERLARWIDDVSTLITRLETRYTAEGFVPDDSTESLLLLEELIVSTYEPDGAGDSQDILHSTTAYLGEALMTIGGGRWGWNTAGHPVILPDPELHLEPIEPFKMVTAAVERPDFGEFTETADRVSAAVTARQEAAPEWKPLRKRTPGMESWSLDNPHPWLKGWLEERRAAHATWTARTGVDTTVWDFTPDSLDALGRLVIDRYTTTDAFRQDEPSPFVQGAIWYVGEVAVRNKQAEWTYREPARGLPPDEIRNNIYLLRPFVSQPTVPGGCGNVPCYTLLNTVGDKNAGVPRDRFDWHKDPDNDNPGT